MKKRILIGLTISLIASSNILAMGNQPSQPKQELIFDWTGVDNKVIQSKENNDKVLKQLRETAKFVDTNKDSAAKDMLAQAKKQAEKDRLNQKHAPVVKELQEAIKHINANSSSSVSKDLLAQVNGEKYHDCLDTEDQQPAKTPFWTTRKKITLVVAAITTVAACGYCYNYCQNNPEAIEQLKNTAWIYVQSAYGTAVTYKDFLIAWTIAKATTLKGYFDFAFNTVKNAVAGIVAKKSLRLEERFSSFCSQSKSLVKNLYQRLWPWATTATAPSNATCPLSAANQTNVCSMFERH